MNFLTVFQILIHLYMIVKTEIPEAGKFSSLEAEQLSNNADGRRQEVWQKP